MMLPLFSIALHRLFIKLNSFTDETEIPSSSACPSNTQSASWSMNMWDDWTATQWDRGRIPKEKTIKCKGGREWIHSAYYDITRGTCANNRPLSLDLGVFVQNYTEALCSQTALETALMFIQIPSKCRIMVTLISSLLPSDRAHTEKNKERRKKCLKWREMCVNAARCGILAFNFFSSRKWKEKHWKQAPLHPILFCQLSFAWNCKGDLLQLFIHSIALH